MANWIKVPAKMIRESDLIRNAELNVDIELDVIFGPLLVNTEKITSYSALCTEDGELSPHQSEIMVDSGYVMLINLPFDKLDNLIRKPKKTTDE